MTFITINIKQRYLFILNKEHKIITKLRIESYSLPLESGKFTVLRRLIIVPIKGYSKIFCN